MLNGGRRVAEGRKGNANIGITGETVKQNTVSTSQIVQPLSVAVTLHLPHAGG
jgi:hypothetical protein